MFSEYKAIAIIYYHVIVVIFKEVRRRSLNSLSGRYYSLCAKFYIYQS